MQIAQNDFIMSPMSGVPCFSPEECNKIIELSNHLPLGASILKSPDGKQSVTNNSVRKSENKWLLPSEDSSWIYKKIEHLITEVIKNYKFDLSGIENIQIARYKDNGFYEWHSDIGKGATSLRKLSVTVQLSEADSYEGGNLEFYNAVTPAAKKIGHATVFPSFLMHRVKPVTSGERWSLVAWVTGPPFR